MTRFTGDNGEVEAGIWHWDGCYMEGQSPAANGWFCIEVDSEREGIAELQKLGFDDAEIARARDRYEDWVESDTCEDAPCCGCCGPAIDRAEALAAEEWANDPDRYEDWADDPPCAYAWKREERGQIWWVPCMDPGECSDGDGEWWCATHCNHCIWLRVQRRAQDQRELEGL